MPSPCLTRLTLIVPIHAQQIKFATIIFHPHTAASPPSGPAHRRSSPDQHDSQAPARSITTYLPRQHRHFRERSGSQVSPPQPGLWVPSCGSSPSLKTCSLSSRKVQRSDWYGLTDYMIWFFWFVWLSRKKQNGLPWQCANTVIFIQLLHSLINWSHHLAHGLTSCKKQTTPKLQDPCRYKLVS